MLLCLLGLALGANPLSATLGTFATTASDEYAIGREYSSVRAWLVGVYVNPEQQARVERLARRVVAASDRPDLVVNVTLLDSPQINASAYPGGFLLVNRGTVEMLGDDELAFVLGHELSHAILRHGVNAMNLQQATKSVAAIQASRAASDRKAAEQAANDLYLMTASYSRQFEYEADLYGLLYTVRAGMPGDASVRAMSRLRDSVGGDVDPNRAAYSSHPLFVDRIDQLGKGLDGIKATHHQFEAGLGFLKAGRPGPAIAAFQQFLTVFPHSNAAWANLGAAHLTMVKPAAGDAWQDVLPLHTDSGERVRAADDGLHAERAADALAHALEIAPHDPVALGLAGVLARRGGSLPEARQFLERALASAPDAVPLLVDLGNVAAQEGKHDEALKLWEKASALAPEQAEPLVNTALLLEQDKKKKPATAAWTRVAALPGMADLAAAHLEALGQKKKEAEATATPGPETLTFGKAKLALRQPIDELLAALGTPDADEAYEEGAFRYLAWDAHSVEAITQDGRLVELFAFGTSTVTTGAGVGMGADEAALLRAYGPPTSEFELEAIHGFEWAARGIGATLTDGKVTELDLFLPE